MDGAPRHNIIRCCSLPKHAGGHAGKPGAASTCPAASAHPPLPTPLRPRPSPACSSLAPRLPRPAAIYIHCCSFPSTTIDRHTSGCYYPLAVHGHNQPRALAAPHAVVAAAQPPSSGGRRRHLSRHHRHVPPARCRR